MQIKENTMSFLQEFKKFAVRGNVVDLAVAVVVGGAFGKIVSSLVDGIVMPLIGLLLGGINIASKQITIGAAIIKWGAFLQSVIDFTLIAFSIFLVIKAINVLKRNQAQETNALTTDQKLLTEIRDLLKK